MKGYVRRKGDRWYAVIYEGVDPATGKERRSWHAAGTDRADAERARSEADGPGERSPGSGAATSIGPSCAQLVIRAI